MRRRTLKIVIATVAWAPLVALAAVAAPAMAAATGVTVQAEQ